MDRAKPEQTLQLITRFVRQALTPKRPFRLIALTDTRTDNAVNFGCYGLQG